MITRFILNTSLFASFITFVFCVITNISIGESVIRSAIVFVGFYGILIVFFIFLRYLFRPTAKAQREIVLEEDESDEKYLEEMKQQIEAEQQLEEQIDFEDGSDEDGETTDKHVEKGDSVGQRGSG